MSQKELYDNFYPAMMRICLRYTAGNIQDAGSLYNRSMLKVFNRIDQYKGEGSFESWIKRVVINTCIDHGRQKIKFKIIELTEETDVIPLVPDIYNRISGNEIIKLLQELPGNARLVFNLFVMEGFSHADIGKMLDISPGTSKWHLSEARKLLMQKIKTNFKKETFSNA